MPNKKVKFFKSIEDINYKIIYIKDKDLLGFDSANIHSFTFKLYDLEKFGISKNFIYMEDDFFIGKPLNKSDFFYYDELKRKVVPYLLTKFFQEMNQSSILAQYYNLLEKKDFIHPHSKDGWWFSIYNTNKYFIERYKLPLILCKLLVNQRLELNDIQFVNNKIYNNLRDLSKDKNINSKGLVYFYEGNELLIDGKNIKVNSENVCDYIEKLINYEIRKYKNEINVLKEFYESFRILFFYLDENKNKIQLNLDKNS